jgi:ketosteroid isomerase-like protein
LPIAAPAELFLARRAAARRLRALAWAARRLAAFEARWRRRVALAKLPRTCWACTLTGAAPGCPDVVFLARAGAAALPVACFALEAPPSSCTRAPISTPPSAIAAAASAPTARGMLLRACIGPHSGTSDTWAAMSQENVELVRRVYERWALGDFSEGDLFHPEVDFEMPDWPHSAASHGLEGMRNVWAQTLGAWDDFRAEGVEYLESGPHVVVLNHIHARGKGSGADVSADTATVWTFERGKVVRLALYWDSEKALEAAGLPERH